MDEGNALYPMSMSSGTRLDHIHLLRVRRDSSLSIDAAIFFTWWAYVTLLRRKYSFIDHRAEWGRDIFGDDIVG